MTFPTDRYHHLNIEREWPSRLESGRLESLVVPELALYIRQLRNGHLVTTPPSWPPLLLLFFSFFPSSFIQASRAVLSLFFRFSTPGIFDVLIMFHLRITFLALLVSALLIALSARDAEAVPIGKRRPSNKMFSIPLKRMERARDVHPQIVSTAFSLCTIHS